MFDNFFLFLTLLGNYAFIWFSLAVAVAIRQKNRAEHIVLTTVSAIGFSFFVTTFLKLFFRQPRPTSNFEFQISNFCPTDFSFPSGHASTSFAAAFVLSHLDRKRAWFYLILASLISYSRLYLGCHRLIDVAGGLFIAIMVYSFLLRFVMSKRSTLAKHRKTH